MLTMAMMDTGHWTVDQIENRLIMYVFVEVDSGAKRHKRKGSDMNQVIRQLLFLYSTFFHTIFVFLNSGGN